MKIKIEPANPEDAEAIMSIKRAAWLIAYPSEELGITVEDIDKKIPLNKLDEALHNWRTGLVTETSTSPKRTFVAKSNGIVVGYTSPENLDERRLGALYIDPKMQGKGIGSKLLKRAIDWHDTEHDIFLHVTSHNDNAIRFYEAHGFTKTGKVFEAEFSKELQIKHLEEIEMKLPGSNKYISN